MSTPESKISFPLEDPFRIDHMRRFLIAFNLALFDPLLQKQGKGMRGKNTITPGGITALQLVLGKYDDLNKIPEDQIESLFAKIIGILADKNTESSASRTELTRDFYKIWNEGVQQPQEWRAVAAEWNECINSEKQKILKTPVATRASFSFNRRKTVSDSLPSPPDEKNQIIMQQELNKVHLEWLLYRLEKMQYWYTLESRLQGHKSDIIKLMAQCRTYLELPPPSSFEKLHMLFNPEAPSLTEIPNIFAWKQKFLEMTTTIQKMASPGIEKIKPASTKHSFYRNLSILLQDIRKMTDLTQQITVSDNREDVQATLDFLTTEIKLRFTKDDALKKHLNKTTEYLTCLIEAKLFTPNDAILEWTRELDRVAGNKKLDKQLIAEATTILTECKALQSKRGLKR